MEHNNEKRYSQDFSRCFLNYVMSGFFILCSILVVLFIIKVLPILDSGKSLLGEMTAAVKEDRMAKAALSQEANSLKETIANIGMATAALVLAEAGMAPPAEANEIVTQSLESIKKQSPRFGKLAGYIQNGSLPHQRKARNAAVISSLKNLATAQEYYYDEHNTYAGNIEELAGDIKTNPKVVLLIIHADKNSFKAVGRHMSGGSEFIYDTAKGGIQ